MLTTKDNRMTNHADRPTGRTNTVLRLSAVLALVSCLMLMFCAQRAESRELTQGERAAITEVANQAWAGSSCSGRITLAWEHEIDATGDAQAQTLIAKGYQLQGYAYGIFDGSCEAGVRSDLEPVEACTTAVHEAGHLAATYRTTDGVRELVSGPHHADGSAVMGDAEGVVADGYVWPACERLVYLTLAQAEDWVWARSSSQTRVQCHRMTASRVQCITSRLRGAGKRPVRKVWRVWMAARDVVKGGRIR